jgi:zinc/manganese transport system substrate-binding protein
MAEIDPAHAAAYTQRARAFDGKLAQGIQQWQATAAALRGTRAVVYHKDWVYLFTWLGISEVGTIEPKPGVPPSGAWLAQLLDEIPKRQAQMVVYAAYQDPKAANFVAQKAAIPAIMLPFTVGGTDQAKDLFSFYADTVQRLAAALTGTRR